MDTSALAPHPRSMRRSEAIAATLLFLSLGCSKEEAPAPPKPRPVRTARVDSRPSRGVLWLPGRVQSTETPELSFRVPGRVARIDVDVGDVVEAGQTVARLEDEDYAARASQAEAEVARAQAEADRTRRAAERAAALYEGEATSESNRDQTRDMAQAAAAQLEAAEQRLRLARRELGYTRLVAQQSGVVVDRRAEPGSNLGQGQPILSLGSQAVEVRVDVPETVLGAIEVESTARVRYAGKEAAESEATVERVARANVDGGSLYPVILSVLEPDLAPGMAVEVQFQDGRDRDDQLVVPASAVVADQDGTFVWTLEPADGEAESEKEAGFRAKAARVSFSHLEGPDAFLVEGVEPGQTVVTAGTRYLKEGMLVREARLAPLVPEDGRRSLAPFVSRRGPAEER
jgi:RND family efflux transporter MFP subunit